MEHIWVSWMEMSKSPDVTQPLPPQYAVEQERLAAKIYRKLYRDIGGEVGWDTRLSVSEIELAALLADQASSIYQLKQGQRIVGICEFWRGSKSETELQHFGLHPAVKGLGLALPFLQRALKREFESGATRIWLHTDEWDSPAAQKVYTKAGFAIYDRKFMDPTPL